MKVSLLDLAVLLQALLKADKEKQIGHLDADHSLNDLRRTMNRAVRVNQAALESAIFACRMLEEEGQSIEHPDGINTASLILKLTPKGRKYNDEYSMFE